MAGLLGRSHRYDAINPRVLPLFHEQVYRLARPELEGLTLSYWMPAVTHEGLSLREEARTAAS